MKQTVKPVRERVIIKDDKYKIGFAMAIAEIMNKYGYGYRHIKYFSTKYPFILKGIIIEDSNL